MTVIKILKTEVLDFCSTANIYGLQHVANQRNHPILRIVWFLIVAVAFILSGISIKSSFDGKQTFFLG